MEKYNNSYKKSCNVKRIRYNGKVYKINIDELKSFLAGAALAVAGVALLIGVGDKAIDNYTEYKNIQQIKSSYVQILNDNTHRTYDNKGYWYDYEKTAKALLQNPDDFDLSLYCIYDQIGTNREEQLNCMNELIEQINFEISKNPEKYKDFEVHKNFGYYLMDNDYISTDEYEYIMESKLESMLESDQKTEEESKSWKK